jgi:hypothetical protein
MFHKKTRRISSDFGVMYSIQLTIVSYLIVSQQQHIAHRQIPSPHISAPTSSSAANTPGQNPKRPYSTNTDSPQTNRVHAENADTNTSLCGERINTGITTKVAASMPHPRHPTSRTRPSSPPLDHRLPQDQSHRQQVPLDRRLFLRRHVLPQVQWSRDSVSPRTSPQ